MIKRIIANNMWQTFRHDSLSDSNNKTKTKTKTKTLCIQPSNINNYKKLYLNNVIINYPVKYDIKKFKN